MFDRPDKDLAIPFITCVSRAHYGFDNPVDHVILSHDLDPGFLHVFNEVFSDAMRSALIVRALLAIGTVDETWAKVVSSLNRRESASA